jgi:hypothetical protein
MGISGYETYEKPKVTIRAKELVFSKGNSVKLYRDKKVQSSNDDGAR